MASTQVFNIQVDLKSRVLFLENRLRELKELRDNVASSPSRRARFDAEAKLIKQMLKHYRAACELEFVFDNIECSSFSSF